MNHIGIFGNGVKESIMVNYYWKFKMNYIAGEKFMNHLKDTDFGGPATKRLLCCIAVSAKHDKMWYLKVGGEAIDEHPESLCLVPEEHREQSICQKAYDGAKERDEQTKEKVWSYIPDSIKPLIQW